MQVGASEDLNVFGRAAKDRFSVRTVIANHALNPNLLCELIRFVDHQEMSGAFHAPVLQPGRDPADIGLVVRSPHRRRRQNDQNRNRDWILSVERRVEHRGARSHDHRLGGREHLPADLFAAVFRSRGREHEIRHLRELIRVRLRPIRAEKLFGRRCVPGDDRLGVLGAVRHDVGQRGVDAGDLLDGDDVGAELEAEVGVAGRLDAGRARARRCVAPDLDAPGCLLDRHVVSWPSAE